MTEGQDPKLTPSENANSFLERRKAFGEILRDARVNSGCSINELAQSTRISRDFLIALEEGRFEVLPGAIFARGFIRSLCKALGVDSVPMVAAFDASWAASPEKSTPMDIPNGQRDIQSGLRKKRTSSRGGAVSFKGVDPRILVSAGVAVLIGLGALVYALQPPKGGVMSPAPGGLSSAGQREKARLKAKAVVEAPVEPVAPVGGSMEPMGAAETEPVLVPIERKEPAAPVAVQPVVEVEPSSEKIAETAVVSPKVEAAIPIPVKESPSSSVPPPDSSEKGTQVILLVVKEAVKVRVKVDKGDQSTLDLQPNTYTYQFQDKADFMIYDAGSAEMLFNGKSLGSLGSKGRVRRLSFRAADPESKKM